MHILIDVHRLVKSQNLSARLKVTLSAQELDAQDSLCIPLTTMEISAIVRKDEKDFCFACRVPKLALCSVSQNVAWDSVVNMRYIPSKSSRIRLSSVFPGSTASVTPMIARIGPVKVLPSSFL